ncbi:MAG: hypothetical protein ACKO96_11395 [Flammeovirgaceae bacterium]
MLRKFKQVARLESQKMLILRSAENRFASEKNVKITWVQKRLESKQSTVLAHKKSLGNYDFRSTILQPIESLLF